MTTNTEPNTLNAFELLDTNLITNSDPKELLDKIREFCPKYFNASKNHKNQLIRELSLYSGPLIQDLCNQLNAVLESEPMVVSVNSRCYVFGDIHGNLKDLFEYEQQFWGSEDSVRREANYVFLGNYVDSGPNSVEVVLYLFALKLSQPKQFTLLRGNHETREVNKSQTFFKECLEKFGRKKGAFNWRRINRSFDRLPLAAVIDNRVFCCHGGIPNPLPKVADILNVSKPMIHPKTDNQMVFQFLWNDPIDSIDGFTKKTERLFRQKAILFKPNTHRNNSSNFFTKTAVKRFLTNNGLQFVIRSHEYVKNGYKFTSEKRVLTVFSSSGYNGEDNTTACVEVTSGSFNILPLKLPDDNMFLSFNSLANLSANEVIESIDSNPAPNE